MIRGSLELVCATPLGDETIILVLTRLLVTLQLDDSESRRRDTSNGAGSPWLAHEREPDQLGIERKEPPPAFGGLLVELVAARSTLTDEHLAAHVGR